MLDDMEDLTYVEVTGLVRDEGTILILEGVDTETCRTVLFAADRRPAQAILEALEAGESPEAAVPSWAFVGGA